MSPRTSLLRLEVKVLLNYANLHMWIKKKIDDCYSGTSHKLSLPLSLVTVLHPVSKYGVLVCAIF